MVICQEEGKKKPIPKQGSTVILLIYPKQDLTHQVLKAPCLCIERGGFLSPLCLWNTSWGAALCWAALGGLSPTFSKPVQLSHSFRTGPQIEVFSVAAASWDIWPPECIPLGMGKGFGGSWRSCAFQHFVASLLSSPAALAVDPRIRRKEKSLSV